MNASRVQIAQSKVLPCYLSRQKQPPAYRWQLHCYSGNNSGSLLKSCTGKAVCFKSIEISG